MERHQITGHTELIGLMAYPIRHSQSPAIHNAAYEKLGVDIVNLAFEVNADDLEDAIKGLRALKMRGSNISMPNKTIVHKYLDEVSPAAMLCGAVNTIVNRDGYLIGHNTDGIGYVQSLKDNSIDPAGKKVTIVGSGGAATAVQIQSALDESGKCLFLQEMTVSGIMHWKQWIKSTKTQTVKPHFILWKTWTA